MKAHRIIFSVSILMLFFGGVIAESESLEQANQSKAVFFVH
jgi:hypothetical protein